MGHLDTPVSGSVVLTTAIVAHTDRSDMAQHLSQQVGAAHLSMDDGTLGCEGNHKKVWQWHAHNTYRPWSVVMEDDAVPIPQFVYHAGQALACAPTDIVSFYLGKHWIKTMLMEKRKRRAISEAKRQDAHWIVSHKLLHAVAVAIKTPHIPDMLRAVNELPPNLPIDQAITAWAVGTNQRVSYTWPSLADHADKPTLFKHFDGLDRPPGRVAYQTGTNPTWTHRSVLM